jgi:5-hydroxyisourate hydrolase-like protein (transthyretin family)
MKTQSDIFNDVPLLALKQNVTSARYQPYYSCGDWFGNATATKKVVFTFLDYIKIPFQKEYIDILTKRLQLLRPNSEL